MKDLIQGIRKKIFQILIKVSIQYFIGIFSYLKEFIQFLGIYQTYKAILKNSILHFFFFLNFILFSHIIFFTKIKSIIYGILYIFIEFVSIKQLFSLISL